ncbi:MAG: helix-turn-helix transcriptional regulator [Bdellovibrionales bacterium]|nr:helix-turn-helix transcriptional regulator [Bdellovibrionales bacterium]
MTLHSNLRRILENRGLTLRQVTVEAGIKRSTLSDWLAGSRPRELREVYRLSKYLGVTLEELLFEETSTDNQPMTVDLYFEGPVRIRIDRKPNGANEK